MRIFNASRPGLSLFRMLIASYLSVHLSIASADQGQREDAEKQLADLQEQIAELQTSLEEARTEHRDEAQQLKTLDLEIDQTARASRKLREQQSEKQNELEILETERQQLLATLGQSQQQLGEVLRSAYRVDRHSRLKLILNQDDPGQINRMLAYYEYFNRQQVEDIASLYEALLELDEVQARINSALADLEATALEISETMQALEGQRDSRLSLIATLDDRINNEEDRLRELQRNRQDLVLLLERLEDALADIPADLGAHLGVAQQKGQLPMPTSGRVRHAYGQRRAESLHWQGWLIGAEPGSEVNSVAYGRVAYADWLRGYGLIVIIDHGDGFLSLYGNNESLLAEVGDWVEPGTLIGVVGTNPGMSQGLYFELRKEGKAVDPAAWIKR
ncbi:MAG TPA: peptidoglycan DD-metalloendopeptidase family protein [Xanthomonadales bacterium]|nr:peptidoglycan DD-metalloendopeptidase family protein [Xanthomonadales bacterium]